jgi:enoyl-CoA hydratase/carnithine racemase
MVNNPDLEVLFNQAGQIGLITLNRPQALNALTLTMIRAIHTQLCLWETDVSINAVVIRAVPGKAFCAGGDVRWLYQTGMSNTVKAIEFFWHEYRLNHLIAHFGKPYIALMDGITMGGGVGVSLHGSYPIASERFIFAMPETSIGFFPDIGASYLLTRCPDALGIYLGLSGNHLDSSEALNARLIKGIIPSDRMDALLDELVRLDLTHHAIERIEQCLKRYTIEPKITLNKASLMIKQCFSLRTVEAIYNALDQQGDAWAYELLETLKLKSPFSLKLTLEQLHQAQGRSLAECLQMDYDLVHHFMKDSDFYEGVRALLINKDKHPVWNPTQLNEVTRSKVTRYFSKAVTRLAFF